MPSFLQSHPGSWSVAGIKLPDFGITEALSGNKRTAQGGSNLLANNTNSRAQVLGSQTAVSPYSTAQSIPSSSAMYGPSVPSSYGSSSGSAQPPYQAPAGNPVLYNDIQQQNNTGNNQIDSDYENYISSLNSQQNDVQGQGGIAEEKARNAANEQQTAIGREQTQANEGFATQEQQVQKQSQNAMQQARDLYRQMQQQNIAQLSGSGLSSSSVAEAMAEKLGVETARRIAGVTGSRDEVLQNISRERTNINSYLNERLTNVQDQLKTTINEIQQSVLSQIRSINDAKQVAASDRANKRAQLLSQAQSSIAQLTAQAQNFQQDLQMKMQERQQRLADAAASAEAESKRVAEEQNYLMSMLGSNGQFNMGGQQQSQFSPTGYVQTQKKPQDQFDFSQYDL